MPFFFAVCTTVFLFEFWPWTFTIGFNRKISIRSELMILECSSYWCGAMFICSPNHCWDGSAAAADLRAPVFHVSLCCRGRNRRWRDREGWEREREAGRFNMIILRTAPVRQRATEAWNFFLTTDLCQENTPSTMGAVRITSLNPKFNGSHFGLPPSSIHRMTGWVANCRILWRMRTAPIITS